MIWPRKNCLARYGTVRGGRTGWKTTKNGQPGVRQLSETSVALANFRRNSASVQNLASKLALFQLTES